MPVVKVVNVPSSVKYSTQFINKNSTIFFNPILVREAISLTTAGTGTITITLPSGDYLNSNEPNGVKCLFSVTLSGPVTGSGQICNSSDDYTCAVPNSISFNNIPAGSYSVMLSALTNTAQVDIPIKLTIPSVEIKKTDSKKFFYEGFEENASASFGKAHTGHAYWGNSSYQMDFVPPDNKDYIIQWWSLNNNKWKLHEESYTGPRSISGKIDDVRVFPSDARMTTYTYDPLIGKTGEIDPAGNTVTYEYDGLGRLKLTRDSDGNILSKTDYHYADQP